MLIELTKRHLDMAVRAARQAEQRLARYKLKETAAYAHDVSYVADGLGHYLAALAELAVAEYLDLPWGMFELGAVDVGDDIEVRRVEHPSNALRIRAKDIEDARIGRHVSVYLWDDTTAEILGWVPTEVAWTKGRLCACRTFGRCCHYFADSDSVNIHRRHLRRPDTLER